MGTSIAVGISLGFALAMDALAISVSQGLTFNKKNILKMSIIIALIFGVFQGLMPLLGWLLVSQLEKFFDFIKDYDHFFALLILSFLGIKLIFTKAEIKEKKISLSTLIILAIATSIDAFFAGTVLTGYQYIYLIFIIIGLVTVAICFIGAMCGKYLGEFVGKYANIIGGIALILIGINILIQHLYFGG